MFLVFIHGTIPDFDPASDVGYSISSSWHSGEPFEVKDVKVRYV